MVPQRIAVISSATAAGYGDFNRRIKDNPEGYAFKLELFPALMQGEQAGRSILDALAKCRKRSREFDLIAIIRGGGSALELQCFDSYALAREVATFPIPVLTGIGHERDETVLDRVANMRMITPTATAEFIISRARDFERSMDALGARLVKEVRSVMGSEAARLERHSMGIVASARAMLSSRGHALSLMRHRFRSGTVQMLGRKDARLDRTLDTLGHLSKRMLARGDERLGRLELKVSLMDPAAVLGRGYSITYLNGRAVRDSAQAAENDIITTRLYKGTITSSVSSIEGE
jgi:exodeoxyribonuclease VII large subunit